jgi:hypothetical protein
VTPKGKMGHDDSGTQPAYADASVELMGGMQMNPPTTLSRWLDQVGLTRLEPLSRENSIDLDVVRSLTDADLRELGLALGDRGAAS